MLYVYLTVTISAKGDMKLGEGPGGLVGLQLVAVDVVDVTVPAAEE